jgi:hypothetical protein
MHQKRKKPLPFNWKSLTNSNPCSAGSSDQKFKLSSTTSNLKVPQAMTSSWAKSYRNYLSLASNTSQIFNAAMLTGYLPAQSKVVNLANPPMNLCPTS